MSVDLSQFRGKRALVCGMPNFDTKTYQTWIFASAKALRSLDLTAAMQTSGVMSVKSIARIAKDTRAEVVLVLSTGFGTKNAVDGAKAAGVPVLRVWRDGSIDVEESNGGLRSGG